MPRPAHRKLPESSQLHLRLSRNFNNQLQSSMRLSQTAYRAALLHFSVNPLLIRASFQPNWAITTTTLPQTPSSRLYTILFPHCPLQKFDSRQAHTMSNSTPETSAPKTDTDSNTQRQEQQAPEQAQSQEQLYLPETASSEGEDKQLKLGLGPDGAVSLDHLGPMVVNVDGTLSRIGNWEQMTEMERKTTLRVLGKRNKQRLEALKAQGVE